MDPDVTSLGKKKGRSQSNITKGRLQSNTTEERLKSNITNDLSSKSEHIKIYFNSIYIIFSDGKYNYSQYSIYIIIHDVGIII